MAKDIKLVYDNDKITITDGDRLIVKGTNPLYKVLANNVAKNVSRKRYEVSEDWEGHKKIVTLRTL